MAEYHPEGACGQNIPTWDPTIPLQNNRSTPDPEATHTCHTVSDLLSFSDPRRRVLFGYRVDVSTNPKAKGQEKLDSSCFACVVAENPSSTGVSSWWERGWCRSVSAVHVPINHKKRTDDVLCLFLGRVIRSFGRPDLCTETLLLLTSAAFLLHEVLFGVFY